MRLLLTLHLLVAANVMVLAVGGSPETPPTGAPTTGCSLSKDCRSCDFLAGCKWCFPTKGGSCVDANISCLPGHGSANSTRRCDSDLCATKPNCSSCVDENCIWCIDGQSCAQTCTSSYRFGNCAETSATPNSSFVLMMLIAIVVSLFCCSCCLGLVTYFCCARETFATEEPIAMVEQPSSEPPQSMESALQPTA